MKIIMLVLFTTLCFPLTSGCVTGESNDAPLSQRTAQLLDERIDAAERIYLFAHYEMYNDETEPLWVCEEDYSYKPNRTTMELTGCGNEPFDCEVDALSRLREDLIAGREVVASMIRRCGESWSIDYYFVHPDGQGEYFYELGTDMAGSDCGSYCGWHRCTVENDMYHIDQNDMVHLFPCDDRWSRMLPENNLTCEEQQ